MEKTNSVIRLRNIMLTASSTPSESNNRQHTIAQAWCMIFDLDENGPDAGYSEVFEYVKALRGLFTEVLDYLASKNGSNREMFYEPVEQMSGIVASVSNLHAPWHTVLHYVSGGNIIKLNYIVEWVNSFGDIDEAPVPQPDIDQIREFAQNLYAQIRKAKLPKATRDIFLEIVKSLLDAIHLYTINGPKGLKEGMAKASGILLFNQTEVEAERDSDELKKIAELMHKIDKVYSTAKTVSAIYGGVVKLLPMLGSG